MAEADEPRVIVFDIEATDEIDEADAWWQANRPERPDAVREGLARCLVMLSTLPSIGLAVPGRRMKGVRRLVVDDVPYQLFYQADEVRLVVLRFWDGRKETRPRF